MERPTETIDWIRANLPDDIRERSVLDDGPFLSGKSTAELLDWIDQLEPENERLRLLISYAGPLAWCHGGPGAMESAQEWEKEAEKLLKPR